MRTLNSLRIKKKIFFKLSSVHAMFFTAKFLIYESKHISVHQPSTFHVKNCEANSQNEVWHKQLKTKEKYDSRILCNSTTHQICGNYFGARNHNFIMKETAPEKRRKMAQSAFGHNFLTSLQLFIPTFLNVSFLCFSALKKSYTSQQHRNGTISYLVANSRTHTRTYENSKGIPVHRL